MPSPSALSRELHAADPTLDLTTLAERVSAQLGVPVSRDLVRSAIAKASGKRGRPRERATPAAVRAAKLAATVPTRGQLRRRNALGLVALLLRAPEGLTVAELIDELGCSRATLYRLRDDALAGGVVIEGSGDVGVETTWRIERDGTTKPAPPREG